MAINYFCKSNARTCLGYALQGSTSMNKRCQVGSGTGRAPKENGGRKAPRGDKPHQGKGIGLDSVELDVPGVFAARFDAHELEVQARGQRRGLFGVGPQGEPATTKADDLQPGVVWSAGGRGILRVELDLHHAIVQPSAERL